jgi:hypothetical protein
VKAQYVGDIGDLSKALLLRELALTGLALGIDWLLTHDVGGNEGIHRDYPWLGARHIANNPMFQLRQQPDDPRDCLACACNELVLERMAQCARLQPGERTIRHLEAAINDLLKPQQPRFFSELYDGPENGPEPDRLELRRNSLRELERAEIAFFDPDIGIAFEVHNGVLDFSDLPANGASPQHIYLAELAEFWNEGKSLVIYQHWARWPGGNEQAMQLLCETLQRQLNSDPIHRFSTRRGSGRTYFLVPKRKHKSAIRKVVGDIERVLLPLSVPMATWRNHEAATHCAAEHRWRINRAVARL